MGHLDAELVNADLRRKRTVELSQRIQAGHAAALTRLRTALLVYPYPDPVPEPHTADIRVRAVLGSVELAVVAATAPDHAAPTDGVGIWELSVSGPGDTPLPKGEAEGWARALFGYRCAPLVYRHRSDGGSGWFRRPAAAVRFTVFHGEHGPMHPADVPAAEECA